MQDAVRATEILRELKKRGIKVAIDDFGTGYSSLSYLKNFPINRLKIDRLFVHTITTDKNDAAIVAAIIAMSHNLELKAVAEGVETIEQLDFLRALDCDEMQGYLFSRPILPDEAAKLFNQPPQMLRSYWAAQDSLSA
jgi:EAL domain-containing protein (putative c-di-GMP-specific phosphodiesterase class I)